MNNTENKSICPKCGASREAVLSCLLESPRGSENYAMGMGILRNCIPCRVAVQSDISQIPGPEPQTQALKMKPAYLAGL